MKTETTTIEGNTLINHPLMYKGWLIGRINNMLYAENLATGDSLTPIYPTFDLLKMVIDNYKY